MESNLSNAFLLLGIGMITVFIVLSLVVICGSVLIKVVNKYFPAPESKPQVLKTPLVSNQKIAVLTAVVDHITVGKGKIELIEKL